MKTKQLIEQAFEKTPTDGSSKVAGIAAKKWLEGGKSTDLLKSLVAANVLTDDQSVLAEVEPGAKEHGVVHIFIQRPNSSLIDIDILTIEPTGKYFWDTM